MKKVFIARDRSGICLIMSEKPVLYNGTYFSSGGSVADFNPIVAHMLGIPYPKPGEMIEWPPPSQTAAPEPEPPAEKLVPITSVSQLKVGDMVRNDKLERKVLAVGDQIVALSSPYDHEKLVIRYSLYSLIYWGYQQVASASIVPTMPEPFVCIKCGKIAYWNDPHIRKWGQEARWNPDSNRHEIAGNICPDCMGKTTRLVKGGE